MPLSPQRKLQLCLLGNVGVLIFVVILLSACAGDSAYWRLGPGQDLVLISVRIDTWARWAGLLGVIALVEASRVLVEEFGMPILGFSIYNPDKRHIPEFTKIELQFYANSMFLVSALRSVALTVVTISQIDLAVWAVIVSQGASVLTIRALLNEKTFSPYEPVAQTPGSDNV
jgi:hypothetical protein